jgi:curli production assembly/transport component CsgE
MKLSIVVGLASLICLAQPRVEAQETPVGRETEGYNEFQSDSPNASMSADTTNYLVEIDRLIVDETISKAGHDFMELFFNAWNWPAIANGSFMMVLTERPFRGISTQIIISVNDLVVFESFLQSRYDFLETLTEQAIEQTTNYLINYESILKELEGADMKGTGIY